MLGLYRWFKVSGDQNALVACRRTADLFCNFFLGAGRPVGLAGAPVQNQASIHIFPLLYREKGEKRYLQMAQAIPLADRYVASWSRGEQFYAGPAPRWEGLAAIQAIAELYFIAGDLTYREAFEGIWWSIVEFDRHSTGGFSSGEHCF